MREEKIPSTQTLPNTIDTLFRAFSDLGIHTGMSLIVHSSLKSLGWVNGGPVAVIMALENILGPTGTLMMPTQSGELSDPAHWSRPPVPEAWWSIIRDTMPAYDPDLTPTRAMGVIPETFRKQNGVRRSAHPQISFAAWGHHRDYLLAEHTLEAGLGEASPLGRFYTLDSWILLLGVGHSNNTSLHLAEYRANFPGKRYVQQGAPMWVNGRSQWITFPDLEWNSDDFEAIGAAFAAENPDEVHRGMIGMATAELIHMPPLIDFAVQWMESHRG